MIPCDCLEVGKTRDILRGSVPGVSDHLTSQTQVPTVLAVRLAVTKEGRLLRNISPSLGLCDHFPGSGILNYRPDRDWSLRVCYFGDTSENRCYWHHNYTYYSLNDQP